MATRFQHVAILTLNLGLVVAACIYTAISFNAPTLSPQYPKQHLLVERPLKSKASQQQQQQPQQEQQAKKKKEEISDRGELRRLVEQEGEEGEVKAAKEPHWEVNQVGSMATRPNIKTWPDLVGVDVEEAKRKILEEHPNILVQVVPEGSMTTMDFNLRRVRIHKNKDEKVALVPKQG